MARKTISVKNILKVLCLVCLLQVLLTVYLILKIYISNVMRPDVVNDNLISDDYESLQIYDDSQSFVFTKDETQKINDIFKGERELLKNDIKYVTTDLEVTRPTLLPTVEILGKAAIASYLWEHILERTKSIDSKDNTIYSAQMTLANCVLNYKEGPGLQLDKVDPNVNNFILVVNGRTQEKLQESKEWIKQIKNSRQSPKVVLIMLGNEMCENNWIQEFMYPVGPIRGSFITYDDPSFDEKTTFQWPLGVATYRHFPLLTPKETKPHQSRQFLCNLQATNHLNSSRTFLFSLLKSSQVASKHCVIKERKNWAASESPGSSGEYLNILLSSDITLCPAGINTETYRVYEAIAAGSVPVIEDVPSKGSCDQSSGWRLLKSFNPPVIWVKDWRKIKKILIRELKLSSGEKIVRRKKLLSWYQWFKLRNSDRLVMFLNEII